MRKKKVSKPKRLKWIQGLSSFRFPHRVPAQLVQWFESQRRVLPWREDPSPYRVWISEIMLQQTQVVTVIPYFERFMERFPTVESLALASEEEVMKAWAGLGYYSRARNLRKGAQQIVVGGFPANRAGWLEVPGVGPYTAGAICSIALNQPEALLDGNVERVLSRLFRVSRGRSETSYKETLWELARESVRIAKKSGLSFSSLNQGWMELGALICTPRQPQCERCPLRLDCEARKAQVQLEYPEKKARKEWVEVIEKRVALFSAKGDRVALVQAQEGEWRAGLWDFPERLSYSKTLKLGRVESRHVVTRHKISRTTEVLRLRSAGTPELSRVKWVSIEDPEVPLGSAPKKVLQLIRERYVSAFARS